MAVAWINFVGIKYPNLRHLDFDASYYQRREDLITCASYVVGAENALVNMLACLKKLKTYQVTMFPMTDKIVEAMATNNDRHFERLSFKAKVYALQSRCFSFN